MEKLVILLVCVVGGVIAAPKRIYPQQQERKQLTINLPANYTNIRAEISDNFTCEGRNYGYYADVDNDCQIFHVCLPVDGRNVTYRWSFICPEETIFNQESFTCARIEDSVKCEDAPSLYKLNDNFGEMIEEPEKQNEKNGISEDTNKSKNAPNSNDQSDNKRKSRTG